jgi:hypothetical protein
MSGSYHPSPDAHTILSSDCAGQQCLASTMESDPLTTQLIILSDISSILNKMVIQQKQV